MIDYSSLESGLTPEGEFVYALYRPTLEEEGIKGGDFSYFFNTLGGAIDSALERTALGIDQFHLRLVIGPWQTAMPYCMGALEEAQYDIDQKFRRLERFGLEYVRQQVYVGGFPDEAARDLSTHLLGVLKIIRIRTLQQLGEQFRSRNC